GPAADPLLAALVDLLLPEGDVDLEGVDRVLAGGERVVAVGRGDGDGDARLADPQAADAVDHGDAAEVVALLQAAGDLLHDLLGHALVGLVFEMQDGPPARVDPRRAEEGGDRPGPLVRHLREKGVERDRIVCETEAAAGHRRDERYLVAVGERTARIGVVPVDGVEEPLRLRAEAERRPDVGDAGPRWQLELRFAAAGPLPEAGEEPDDDPHRESPT